MTIFSRKWLKEHGYTPQPDGSLSNEHSANISAVAPATGSAAKAKKDPKLPRPPSPLATKFEALWAGHGGPALTPELRFHKTRKWRFDYACERAKIAIELDGGVFGNGRHNRASGFLKDCEKLNAAAFEGWRVFRLGTGMVQPDAVQQIIFAIRQILDSEP